jgi:hypothetical protein
VEEATINLEYLRYLINVLQCNYRIEIADLAIASLQYPHGKYEISSLATPPPSRDVGIELFQDSPC